MNSTLPDRDTIYQAVLPLYTINDESDIEKFHLIMYHNLLMYAINHQMDLSDLVNYLTQINEYKKIISDVLDVGLSLPELIFNCKTSNIQSLYIAIRKKPDFIKNDNPSELFGSGKLNPTSNTSD